jgi:glycerophosphoryl diester phosphodiesterase
MLAFTSKSRVMNIAHRGACSLAPENTLAAARKAIEAGADMWELDVGLTADGELIVAHDETLRRTSNASDIFPSRRPWSVREFTLEEIRLLDFGSWFIRDDPFGRIKAKEVSSAEVESFCGEPAPTLGEALTFTREHDWLVNVEIKDMKGDATGSSIVEKVIAAIEGLGMEERVLVSSFNHDYLRRLRTLNSRMALGVLTSIKHAPTASLVRDLSPAAYHPRVDIISHEEISSLRRDGVDVNVWVVDDTRTMISLVDAGVSAIFTNFPQRLSSLVYQPD